MHKYLKNIVYPKKMCNDDDIIAGILKYSSIGFISYQLLWKARISLLKGRLIYRFRNVLRFCGLSMHCTYSLF